MLEVGILVRWIVARILATHALPIEMLQWARMMVNATLSKPSAFFDSSKAFSDSETPLSTSLSLAYLLNIMTHLVGG